MTTPLRIRILDGRGLLEVFEPWTIALKSSNMCRLSSDDGNRDLRVLACLKANSFVGP